MKIHSIDFRKLVELTNIGKIDDTFTEGLQSGVLVLENFTELPKNILDTIRLLHCTSPTVRETLAVGHTDGVRGFFEVNQLASEGALQSRKYSSFELGDGYTDVRGEIDAILRAPNVLPTDTQLCANIESLISFFRNCTITLRDAVSLSLGQPKSFLSSKSVRACSQIRLLEYQPDSSSIQKGYLGAHTDYECFTLILQSTNGLEVLPRSSTSWIRLPDNPQALIFLVGDMLEVFSNGYFESCLHHTVACPETRRSAVYFAGLDCDTVVEPLERFGMPQYASIVFGEHLMARYLENYEHLRQQYVNGKYKFSLEFGTGNPYKKNKLERLNSSN